MALTVLASRYPNYPGNTQDDAYDIPGRTDIANAWDYNTHDAELLKHQSLLIGHDGSINTLLSYVDQPVSISSSPSFVSITLTATGNTPALIITSSFIELAQIATPSSPVAGRDRLYFKSDDKLYYLTSAGVEVEVGTGAIGTSGYSGYSGLSGYSGYSGSIGGTGASGYSGYSGYSGQGGLSGYSGYSGTSGYSGSIGYSGKSGYSGYSGGPGPAGVSGYSGYSGTAGAAGLSGYSGYSGSQGYSGESGYSGYSGSTGPPGPSGAGYSGYSGYSGWSGDSIIYTAVSGVSPNQLTKIAFKDKYNDEWIMATVID